MRRIEPRAGWWRTTAFRVTLLHLGLTLLGTLALSAVVWWATTGFALRQLSQEVEHDTGVLLQAGRLGGIASLAVSIDARIAADTNGTQYFLLAAPDGARLAGNLASAPRAPGWGRLRLERSGAAPETELLGFGTALPGGGFLVVARDVAPVRRLETLLLGAAGWVGGAAMLLGLGGGVLIGRSVTRRAAAMDAALARVEAGEIGHRLPVRGGGDEFDRLAQRINAALDRVQGLMQTLRQVTDDIAHDLRTPLNRLRQRLEAMLRSPAKDWRGSIEAAIAEADHLLEIFAALLRIAQVESGARRAGFTRCDLSAIAETTAEVYAPAAEERGQRLETAIAPGIACQGDRELLTQLLANLLDNAVKHGRPGGRIAVTLDPMALVVADDGPGIPAGERELALRRFHRLDAARSTPGSGLGLALVAAVAELHGMALRLEDHQPGLRVVLSLPA
ncbi:two-component sensor histidine kinase [Siccirubricoccus deserti]|uniref:histidine kinase n=1 Tax=Siccirubricoccus deserti TaxID=2013562 RepID=A0A9X0R1T6_9PROT|nr:HAMP domain-containing sensor histidine kinase [Siccirubricoccus deserti]MBC4018089.1 HAMP domain-containing histidine kinase [Siccirubricoccus deserti]GGC52892.1 two-component sensor histidine kinase [Siccirubricoccus deserti]